MPSRGNDQSCTEGPTTLSCEFSEKYGVGCMAGHELTYILQERPPRLVTENLVRPG